MKKDKIIGVLFILIGALILFYRDAGFYGFGGYVDQFWENIIVSSVMIIIGFLFIKKRNY